ncbi:DinB family protein [Jeotgalibacillus aurantiacus]|uniref:DinB family protein n=1 Tax=Jeotgalibacillus aurantiacus TaxID=2763266 RepID=UPI001D0AF610|nr:DinB family protein [Jeotgalibacillus aurantiacus]
MIDLFLYNWQVREDWFVWCESLAEEELFVKRTGGMESLFQNLVHVVDCELLWINHLIQEPVVYAGREEIRTLEDIRAYSEFTKTVTKPVIDGWNGELEDQIVHITGRNGYVRSFTYGKIIRHLISHEIHHIGQLSIWAREIGRKPVSSDLIIRDY